MQTLRFGVILLALPACISSTLPRPLCVQPTHDNAMAAVETVARAPLSDSPTEAGYGALNEQIIDRIQTVQLIDHVKLGYTHEGTLREVSIYHNDPQPIGPKLKEVIHQQFPRSQLVNYETEWESDVGSVTEATVKTADGRICEVSMTSAGDVRFVECIIEENELPAEVREAALRIVPGGQFVECEYREEKRGRVFEAELRVGTVVHVLRLRTNGELLEHMLQLRARLLINQ